MYYEFVSSSAPEQREEDEEEDGEVFNQDSSSPPLPPHLSLSHIPPSPPGGEVGRRLKFHLIFTPAGGRREGGVNIISPPAHGRLSRIHAVKYGFLF